MINFWRTNLKYIFYVIFAIHLGFVSMAQATCNANIELTKPNSRYTDHGDGTVTDNVTKLMWGKCTEGLDAVACTGTSTGFTWKDALNHADNSTLATHTNWRLPNPKEMISIVELACTGPAINAAIFPGVPLVDYATSSTNVNGTDAYWSVSSFSGRPGVLLNNHPNARIRLVRDVE